MGAVTTAMGLLPTRAEIGVLAAVFLLVFRLAQGITVGGESAGSMVFLLEQANKRWRATTSIFSLMGAVGGVLLALSISSLITRYCSSAEMLAGAWRIPFLFSGVLAIIGIYLRAKFWQDEITSPVKTPMKELFLRQKKQLISAILFLSLPAVFTGFIFVYLVPFLIIYLHFHLAQAIQIDIYLMLTMLICLLLGALFSDIFKCHSLLLAGGFLLLGLSAVPLFYWIAQGGQAAFYGLLVFTVIASLAMGAEVVYLVELFKPSVRYSGTGFSHGFAFSFVTGLTPLLLNYLVSVLGIISIAWVMLLAGLVSGLTVMMLKRPKFFLTSLSKSG